VSAEAGRRPFGEGGSNSNAGSSPVLFDRGGENGKAGKIMDAKRIEPKKKRLFNGIRTEQGDGE